MKYVSGIVRWALVGMLLVAAIGCASPGSESGGSLTKNGVTFTHKVPAAPPSLLSLPRGICACLVPIDSTGQQAGNPKVISFPGGFIPQEQGNANALYVYACDDPKAHNPCTHAGPPPPHGALEGAADEASGVVSAACLLQAAANNGAAQKLGLAAQEIWMHRPLKDDEPEQWLIARVAGSPEQALVALSALMDSGPTVPCPVQVEIEQWFRFDEQGFEMIDTEFLVTHDVTLNGVGLDLVASTPLNWYVARCDLPSALIDWTLPSENELQIEYQPFGKSSEPIQLNYKVK